MTRQRSPFFVWTPEQRPNVPTLFCLPFAGGSAAYFASWRKAGVHGMDIVPVQLPGRGSRISEPPFQRMAPLIGAVADAIDPYVGAPYALFGHSMGAAVSIRLAHELRRRGCALPHHLFVSGRRAPHLPARQAPMHLLSDAGLLDELRRLEGTPEIVLADPELLALMLPTIRADLAVVETADPIAVEPLPVPITAFGGEADRVTRGDLAAWQHHTHAGFAMKIYPGGHFFLHAARNDMLNIMQRGLQQ
jgi:medium-chain acyl-[acyl-carrier-protein] hydrolase